MILPAHVDRYCRFLGVPAEERQAPLSLVLDTGHLVEIREYSGRWYLCGLLNEFDIDPEDSLLEGMIEDPFLEKATGSLTYEPSSKRLIYWSEIVPIGADSPLVPNPKAFLREVTDLCKKVSLEGIL